MAKEGDGVMRMVPAEPKADEQPAPALGRDQILTVDDTSEVELVPVPEWGGSIYVRTITAGEWDDFENGIVQVVDGEAQRANFDDYRARFASLVIGNEHGERLFSAEDIRALSKKSRHALDRVLEAGKRFNGVDREDEEALVDHLP